MVIVIGNGITDSDLREKLLYEIELATRIQIFDEVIYISLCTDAFGKGMNLYFLQPYMGK